MRRKLKLIYANFFLIFFRLWYFKRWDVGFGYLSNNRVQIYRCKRGSLAHKFRISYPLKTIRGI